MSDSDDLYEEYSKPCVECAKSNLHTEVHPPNYCSECESCSCKKHMSTVWCSLCCDDLVCDTCASDSLRCSQCSETMCDQCVKLCTCCLEYAYHEDTKTSDSCQARQCVNCEQNTCSECIIGECHNCENEVCKREDCNISCDRCDLQTCGRDECVKRIQGQPICVVCAESGHDYYSPPGSSEEEEEPHTPLL